MSNAFIVENYANEVVLITFTRPELRNALSISVVASLTEYLSALPAGCRRLIFTGSKGVFASGANLNEIAHLDRAEAAAFARRGQALMDAIAGLKPETVAVIDGPCFGGALDLALACDFRVASPVSTFAHPGAGLGIITGWGGTQRLPRLIGQARALEMFMTAGQFSARDALAWGLIDDVADDPLALAIKGSHDIRNGR